MINYFRTASFERPCNILVDEIVLTVMHQQYIEASLLADCEYRLRYSYVISYRTWIEQKPRVFTL